MKIELLLPDGSSFKQVGKVDFLSFRINPTTDSVTVRGVFPNKFTEIGDYDLIPGQYAPVRLILGDNPDALLIPETALVETQAGKNVFVVGQGNKIENRKVEVGTSYKHHWVVSKGLKAGEQVVVEGVQKVRSGMVVKPETATKPGSKSESGKKIN